MRIYDNVQQAPTKPKRTVLKTRANEYMLPLTTSSLDFKADANTKESFHNSGTPLRPGGRGKSAPLVPSLAVPDLIGGFLKTTLTAKTIE